MQMKVEAAEELAGVASKGTKLLQISRSTPLVTAALIGHKQVRTRGSLSLACICPVVTPLVLRAPSPGIPLVWKPSQANGLQAQATNADANVRLTTQEPLDAAHFHSLMARLKSGGPGMQMQ